MDGRTAGVLENIDTITTSDFKTIEYTLHIENSVGIQDSKVLVTRSGTTPYSQEYAIMFDLRSFSINWIII